MDILVISIGLIGLVVGLVGGIIVLKAMESKKNGEAKSLAERILDEARKEAEAVKKETRLAAEAEILAHKKEVESEIREREKQLKDKETRLAGKEERYETKLETLAAKESEVLELEKSLARTERDVLEREESLVRREEEHERKLEEIGGLTAEEARTHLLAEMESKVRHEAARMIRTIESEAREKADRKAKKILASAVQRYAGDFVAETTASTVTLPSEDMKGRIIGREGRNIRALEAATGVDLIIDDTPETVVLSAFSPLRREIARQSLERLITDGRIHPARIEEIVQKVEKEMDVKLRDIGEQATFDLGVHGIHPDIVKLLGQLQYRTSYSQNVLEHSLEVAFLCGIMAAELGLDERMARRAGLLHDIGKAVDHEIEGPHAAIGADIAKKYDEHEEIVHSIAAHHEDVTPDTAIAVLVQAADSLSGARPGARKELLENYVKRLEELENIAAGFKGVTKAYAIQAGREIRVMVDSGKVRDDGMYLLCKDIAKQIEDKMTYPGQIKVSLIRETRASEFAR